MKKILIVKDADNVYKGYIEVLKKLNIQYDFIDVFDQEDSLRLYNNDYSAFIWRAKHKPIIKTLAKNWFQVINSSSKNTFCYPNWYDYKFYDDKIAQYMLLTKNNIATPNSYLFYKKEQALSFAKKTKYPLIYKYPYGAGSANVGLLKSFSEAKKYIKKAFSKGIKTYFKHEIQKDFVFFQQYLPNNDGDYRIVSLYNKVILGVYRYNREGTTFASGSGILEKRELPEKLLNFVFESHKKLGFGVMAYDIMLDENGEYKIIEMTTVYADLDYNYYQKNDDNWQKIANPKKHEEYVIETTLQKWEMI